ncbi:MAG: M23 family metallopeptidase [Desulfovibrio sp.]|nr:M23 family metallopeptidase [Desulfovibrio sp.]
MRVPLSKRPVQASDFHGTTQTQSVLSWMTFVLLSCLVLAASFLSVREPLAANQPEEAAEAAKAAEDKGASEAPEAKHEEDKKTPEKSNTPEEKKADKKKPGKDAKNKPPQKEFHQAVACAEKALPPVKELITSRFGERRLGGPTGIRIHHGLDIRAHLGWPVVALGDGTVTKAGFYGNAGIMVEIVQDDNFISRYAHLQTTQLIAGQRIAKGEKVGEVGCTGFTTGAHLHFSLASKDKGALDPEKYLNRLEDILRPSDAQIPEKIGPQQCSGHFSPYQPAQANAPRRGPVIRGRNGRPMRIDLNALRNFKAPEIPLWQGRRGR